MTSNISIWSFGYGSNMDVKALEAKKHVKVLGNYYISKLHIFNDHPIRWVIIQITHLIKYMHLPKFIFQNTHPPF